MKHPSKLALVTSVALVGAAVGDVGAYAATPTTTSEMAAPPSGGTPETLTGTVTKVSVPAHYLVISTSSGPILVTKKTSYHHVRGGLGGVKVGKKVTVTATKAGGKTYATTISESLIKK